MKVNNEIRNSEINYLTNCPISWKIIKNKYIFSVSKELVGNSFESYTLLSLTTKGIVKKSILNFKGKLPASFNTYQKVKKNDIVLCLFDLDVSAVFSGISNFDGMISSAYKIIKCSDSIYPKYLSYWFNMIGFRRLYIPLSKSLRYTINSSNFKEIYSLMPPLTSQKKIATFLDNKVKLIENTIAKTKESIEQYKQYKQSLITETVTKGLNSNAEMKESGIEWVGEIPKNWDLVRIKNTSLLRGRIGWQGLKSSDYIDKGAYLITGTDFDNGIINWSSCVCINENRYKEDENIHIKENDLLITKDGTIGKIAIVKNCPSKVSLNSGILLIRNTKNIKYNIRYLYYILLSNVFWEWYNNSQMGNSTIKHLYQCQFYNFKFMLPPILEQQQITNYLDTQCSDLDKIIKNKEEIIEKLNDYKKSLIYEVVTGKKEIN